MFFAKVIYKCKPGARDAYCKEVFATGVVDATRKEKGNVDYTYSLPVDSENDVLMLEVWESAEDWENHKGTPHVKDLQAIKAKFVLGTVADTFTLSKT